MRQKELRIALVCYGGVSLAVYMHGVTKELWHALRASQVFAHGGDAPQDGAAVYHRLLQRLEERGLQVRILADIIAGASAGGINSILLAQAIHTGQSLDPLTDLWLETADVDELLDPAARPGSEMAKFWARPLIAYLLHRPGNAISESVAPETRSEVRQKLSRLIRSRWFEPPFSGDRFAGLMDRALDNMARLPAGPPLLPQSHPLDLFVTATDFKGHLQTLRLHSPKLVRESEHRLTIDFHAAKRISGSEAKVAGLASRPELIFAARATAAFPGAFPPMTVQEIDRYTAEHKITWPERDAFLRRIMPEHSRSDDLDNVALIDGSVLVNAPFADAMGALHNRPAAREIDRRFVYIDPTPERSTRTMEHDPALPGFFQVIFGALSSIPREQPIRDSLEAIEQTSREMAQLRDVVMALRPEVEETVERLFGGTLFFDRPTPRRIASWRARAQNKALEQAGFAYHGYAQLKFSGIVTQLARLVLLAASRRDGLGLDIIAQHLLAHLKANGLDRMMQHRGTITPEMITFLRQHDLAFRIRRLRLLARRVTQEWEADDTVSETDREAARVAVYEALSLYLDKERVTSLGADFQDLAGNVFKDPGAVLDYIAQKRDLIDADEKVDTLLAEAMTAMPPSLRRMVLLTYLGFPFYDTVTLPLLRGEGLTEFDPIKVDRISPDDCSSLRDKGEENPLRGAEFYNFGAFFSRAYRENDYLWGRLHGAERMIELIASTMDAENGIPDEDLAALKREAYKAILDEEAERLIADPGLIVRIRDLMD